jgi:hypothetical protein
MDKRTPEHRLAQTLLDLNVRVSPALATPKTLQPYGAALDEALRAIVEQARGDDDWVSGNDLLIRIGAVVRDRLGGIRVPE